MNVRDLQDGTRVDVRILQKVKRGDEWIDDRRHYASTIFHVNYDGVIEMTMPMRQGKLVLIPMNMHCELIFVLEDNRMVQAIAEFSGRIRRGSITVLRANLITPIEKCQRREYYRLNCMLPLRFILLEENEGDMAQMADIRASMAAREQERSLVFGDGTITNISGGGMRFVTEEPLANENEYLFLSFAIKNGTTDRLVNIVGQVIGRSKTDDRKYAYRTKILFKDSRCQELIIRYIFETERMIRRKELR